MAYRSKKLRRKVKPLTIIILSAIVVVLALTVVLLLPSKERRIYNQFQNPDLDKENHVYVEINYKKLVKKIEEGKGFLLFVGSPEDPDSRLEIVQYNEEFEKQNVGEYFTKIYYINADKLKEKQQETLEEKYEIYKEAVPELIYIADKEVKHYKNAFTGETGLAVIKNFYLKVIKDIKAQ